MALLARHTQRRIGERDRGLQARYPVARLPNRVAQVADLPRQAAQEAAVELRVGVVEHQRRLAEPGHDPARDHVRAPGNRVVGAVERDPLVHQRAGVGAGDAGLGGAQVAQPAEAEERGRPVLGRRGHLEGGAGIAGDDLAREREAAGIDFACPGCIAGPQVLRRDGDAVRFAEGKRPVDDGMRGDAAGDPAKEATRQEHGQSSALRDRNARHRGVGSLLAGVLGPAGRNIAKGGAAANRRNPFKSFADGRRRSRPGRPGANQGPADDRAGSAGRRLPSAIRCGRGLRSPRSAGG